jgi:hypothetical protein
MARRNFYGTAGVPDLSENFDGIYCVIGLSLFSLQPRCLYRSSVDLISALPVIYLQVILGYCGQENVTVLIDSLNITR